VVADARELRCKPCIAVVGHCYSSKVVRIIRRCDVLITLVERVPMVVSLCTPSREGLRPLGLGRSSGVYIGRM